jgi:hypothetical protein
MASITKKPYAIGGALAMSAHGYVRQTTDVDAFVLLEDRLEWLRAARAVGLTVDEVFSKVHYIAFLPKHRDPRVRIDLLFPAGEPELTAVEYPVPARIGGILADVFSIDLLAMAKFQSDRPEDARDFDRMFNLGMLDPVQLRRIIASIDRDEAKRFDRRIADLARPPRPPPRPRRIKRR